MVISFFSLRTYLKHKVSVSQKEINRRKERKHVCSLQVTWFPLRHIALAGRLENPQVKLYHEIPWGRNPLCPLSFIDTCLLQNLCVCVRESVCVVCQGGWGEGMKHTLFWRKLLLEKKSCTKHQSMTHLNYAVLYMSFLYYLNSE